MAVRENNKSVTSARAAIVRAKGAPFVIENVRIAPPRPDEVLIRVVATGVCHTDLIVRDQYYPVPLPSVLGHEGAGTVVAVGNGVSSIAPGDHVVLTFVSCGDCRYCCQGAPSYCGQFYGLNLGGGYGDNETATTDVHGAAIHDHFFGQSSFATYALANVRNVVKVRKDAPLELLGPLGCGLQTGAGAVLNALRVKPGSTFVTFGAGAVGLAAAMAARIAGAQRIIAVDILPHRLALALELGVTDIVNASECDPVAKVIEICGGGADYSLESTGLPRVVRQAVDALGTRGTCGIVGAPPLQTEASFDVNGLMIPGKTIRGIVEGDSIPQIFIPQLIEFFLQGRFPFDRLVRFYDFENINEAVADAASGRTIKPVLKMSQGGTP
jgi:aryl-alcohol dehydrogenase